MCIRDSNQINTLDIGIGRFPVSNTTVAANIINKIMNYDSPKSFGAWKNNFTFNADNGDANIPVSYTHLTLPTSDLV